MTLSNEVRRLQAKWNGGGGGWPKRLEWIEIHNMRGWTGQRVEFRFPIAAIVGENGSGKSSLIQAAASVYRANTKKDTDFASDFFPQTYWDKVTSAKIRYSIRQGPQGVEGEVRKPTTRWLGNTERPVRDVNYIDLSRIQPVAGRVGFQKIAKSKHHEVSAESYDDARLARLSRIMGKKYESAKMALTDVDPKRSIPVLLREGQPFSGFHQGSGETTMVEFLQTDPHDYSLLLIDEIETSLHPRSQRRLIRELADRCRERQLQIILTSHSPYILEELPLEARIYVFESGGSRQVLSEVSPNFALTKMDDEPHFECDLFVEDHASEVMLMEILSQFAPQLVSRCKVTTFGAANAGRTLGTMVIQDRFWRPTCVFLDGDVTPSPGCGLLPGEDAPERVVFDELREQNWAKLADRINRPFADMADACQMAMTLGNHHEWVRSAATKLTMSGNVLWHMMCAEWAGTSLHRDIADAVIAPIETALIKAET